LFFETRCINETCNIGIEFRDLNHEYLMNITVVTTVVILSWTMHHRLLKPCVNGDISFLWESETFWLFSGPPLKVRPPNRSSRKMAQTTWIHKDAPFALKNNRYFSYPGSPGPLLT